ncbi:MAG: SPOR domain-containing protein [Bacteroidales bacterium]|jgi:hypothetical protein|nr:SPOR domain-containing protein [Bacteroidales bacterium]MCI1785443.1 SPOR domain-containing protein [Bacteroidales bacterium]
MKKIFVIIALAASVLLTGSCDFFRIIAGRPTSAEIEFKKSEINAEKKAHKAKLDSLKKAELEISDSLAVLDSIAANGEIIMNPSKLGGLYTTVLNAKYYIVIGSFMDKSNASRLAVDVSGKGYEVTLISFRNGYNAVGVCPGSSLVETYGRLKQLRKQPFCPKGAWILANE